MKIKKLWATFAIENFFYEKFATLSYTFSKSKDESDVGATGAGSSSGIRTRQSASPAIPTSNASYNSCNTSSVTNAGAGGSAPGANSLAVEAAVQPLRDQQRQMTERLVKLQHTLGTNHILRKHNLGLF